MSTGSHLSVLSALWSPLTKAYGNRNVTPHMGAIRICLFVNMCKYHPLPQGLVTQEKVGLKFQYFNKGTWF